MRVAGENEYELNNGENEYELHNSDSLAPITDDFHVRLVKALNVVGEPRPVKIRLMFEMEAGA